MSAGIAVWDAAHVTASASPHHGSPLAAAVQHYAHASSHASLAPGVAVWDITLRGAPERSPRPRGLPRGPVRAGATAAAAAALRGGARGEGLQAAGGVVVVRVPHVQTMHEPAAAR
jgi:hypothetical protein